MSTDNDGGQDGSGGHRVPSQEQYEQQTADTSWVRLKEADGEFQVREIAPLKLLRDMKKYGVAQLLGGEDDDVDMRAMLEDGDFDGFIENVVLSNVLQPNCYWDETGDGDFDLAALKPQDLMVVITGMTGQDQDDLEEQMDDTFRG